MCVRVHRLYLPDPKLNALSLPLVLIGAGADKQDRSTQTLSIVTFPTHFFTLTAGAIRDLLEWNAATIPHNDRCPEDRSRPNTHNLENLICTA